MTNKMEILQLTETDFKCVVHNTTLEYMNQLRQRVWDIPTMAFKDVVIHENSSLAKDTNMIANRINLIPLDSSSVSFFSDYDKCECKKNGCDKCSVIFELKVANKTSIPIMITAADIVSVMHDNSPPFHHNVVICCFGNDPIEVCCVRLLNCCQSKNFMQLLWLNVDVERFDIFALAVFAGNAMLAF
jgi:hypothetical protein